MTHHDGLTFVKLACVRVERILPSDEAYALMDLTREIAERELAPRAAGFESRGEFPRDVIRTVGRAGLLGLPYAESDGGGGQPYEVYLQVLEILAGSWLAIAEAVSVHTLSCFPVAEYGTERQRKLLPELLGGDLLGAYCLSEPQGGSDAGALATRAVRAGDEYVVTGTKAWITHGGRADFYAVFCRTGGPGAAGISCLLADADTPGLLPQPPERTMGLWSSAPAQIVFDGARSRRTGWSAARVPGSRLRCGRWTPAGSASPRARSGWPRRRSTTRPGTRASGNSSAGRSWSSRA